MLLPAAVGAETLNVEVRRPAPAGDAYILRSMGVERFAGTDGRALAIALERRLADARGAGGEPLFDMFDAGRGEGALSGRADIEIEETRFQGKRRFCPNTRDAGAKCDDQAKETVEVTCRRRIVTLDSDVRMVRTDDGRVIYSRNLPGREEASWCPGDTAPPEAASVVQRLISNAAGEAAADFIPYARVEAIRLREDRKGLVKPDSEAFKVALRATKTSGAEACRQFAAIAANAPDQRSVAFNLGLCAEASGDLAEAIDRYRGLGPDREAQGAIERVVATRAARAQDQAREGARR